MTLDEALRRPLASVRDDGFSATVLLRLHRAEERRRLMLWGAATLALLPLLWGVTLVPLGAELAADMTRVATSPAFASVACALVLLWSLLQRPVRF